MGEIISSYSGGTGEWDSECKVYHRKQQIGYLDETLASEHLCIRGYFDYTEDRKDNEGIPNIIDNALYLSIEDLVILKEIMEQLVMPVFLHLRLRVNLEIRIWTEIY